MGMVRHIVVDRSDVEACNTDDPVQMLSPLVADAEAAWKLRGKLSISFHGYDEDPRALYTAPDVRKFVPRVNAACRQIKGTVDEWIQISGLSSGANCPP